MPTSVDVTRDGMLALTVDGVAYQPLPVSAVRAAYQRVSDAENVQRKQAITDVAGALVAVLAGRPDSMTATVTVTSNTLSAVVDAATFTAITTQMGLTPDTTGKVTYGPLTVTQTPPP